ncbi:MAG: family 10 glycosylhydrolase [Clostridia bacterium]|nr:family 10 glycosylhydrolase [Clostridia bacterium]
MKNIVLIIISAVVLLALSFGAFRLFLPPDPQNAKTGKTAAGSDTAAGEDDTDPPRRPDDIRGVWIATVDNIDFPSKQGLSDEELKAELDDIVSTSASAGLNSIFFQVRPTSDALYYSSIFPASAYVSGRQGEAPGFDILEYLIGSAKKDNIKIYAWINPMRVTASGSPKGEDGYPVFAESNPAASHADTVFEYNSLYYYNIGLPEVRDMISEGAAEVAANYAVAGVVFDDYFYPYPKEGCTVNDEAAFAEYGADFGDIADWRRDNVNKLIKLCRDSVKAANEDCSFGVSPFGIWQNLHEGNGGSQTNGLEAYSEIYCDALAWIEGEYVDFICPQIYWNIGYPAAEYKTLVDWWNNAVDGHDSVKLLIGHGVYKISGWENENEIYDQLIFAASKKNYRGSVFYGYSEIKADTRGVRSTLSGLFGGIQ